MPRRSPMWWSVCRKSGFCFIQFYQVKHVKMARLFRGDISQVWAFTTLALTKTSGNVRHSYIMYKDGNVLLTSKLSGNVMTQFGVLLAFIFLDTRWLPQLWQSLNTFYTMRFWNIFKRKKIVIKHACYRHNWLVSEESYEVWKCSFIS